MTPSTGQDRAAPRCTYEWSVGEAGKRYVEKYVRCRNRTKAEDGRCYLHHDASGRFDRRPR